MKIQLIFFSFIVLSSLQWIPADGQRKTGTVNYHLWFIFIKTSEKPLDNLFNSYIIYLSHIICDVVNERQVIR